MSPLQEQNPAYFEGKSWSRFHRANLDANASMVDIDHKYTRFCKRCGKTLVLVEDTKNLSQTKPVTAIKQLAIDAGVPAWRVYIEGDPIHPEFLHVQQVAPKETRLRRYRSEKVIARLEQFQTDHDFVCEKRPLKTVRFDEHPDFDVLPSAAQARDWPNYTPDSEGWAS